MILILMERDYALIREIERWRYCMSRHVRVLAGFSGRRACDRRLKALVDTGYIERKMILYGVPGVYYLTHKGKMLIGANKRPCKIRVQKISHDTAVLDTAIYFMQKYGIKPEDIITEKQLYSKSGFVTRKHHPDFVFTNASETCCVEVELTAKARGKFEKNISENYLEYKTQYWIMPKGALKIKQMIEELTDKYPNIKTIELEEVEKNVRDNNESNQSEQADITQS